MSRTLGADPVCVFGEVLFDRFSDGREVFGGAPFNVAWNLQALGVTPFFISRVGEDRLGHRILESMSGWGMTTDGVQIDSDHPTGTVEVTLSGEEPTFEIASDRAYDWIEDRSSQSGDSVLYHGSLVARSDTSRTTLMSVVRRHQGTVFFDVNLRSPWWETEVVLRLLQTTHHLKVNENELRCLEPEARGLRELACSLLSRSRATRLYVTRGAQGAIVFAPDRNSCEVRPPGATPLVDAVGAGDAFSAVLIIGHIEDWPLETTLARAQEFAGAVVGLRGATTADRKFYERFAANWRD